MISASYCISYAVALYFIEAIKTAMKLKMQKITNQILSFFLIITQTLKVFTGFYNALLQQN